MSDSETPERCPGFPVIGGPCDKTLREVEAISTQALSALVEKWEKRADSNPSGISQDGRGFGGGLRDAASDLRQLLDPPE